MTDEQQKHAGAPIGNQNHLVSGVWSYLDSGHLSPEMRAFQQAKLQQLCDLTGNKPHNQDLCELATMQAVVIRLCYKHLLANYRDDKELPSVLKTMNSYMESYRRTLLALGLAPMEAIRLAKAAQSDDQSEAKQIIEQYRQKDKDDGTPNS